MALTLQHTLIRRDGTQELSSSVVDKDVIVFGRGSGCDVVLSGSEFSLNHARLSRNGTTFLIDDLNSLSGVSVNGKLVKQHRLSSGETIGLGSREYLVTISGESISFAWTTTEPKADAIERDPKQLAEAFYTHSSLPSMRTISWSLIILTVLGGLVYPFLSKQRLAWSPGELTANHKPIEANCASCHEGNFAAVSDNACQKCHALTEHDQPVSLTVANVGATTEFLNRPDVERRITDSRTPHTKVHHARLAEKNCVSCHQEHNGPHALISSADALCVDCHASLKNEAPETKLLNVVSWDKHPDFFGQKVPTDSARIELNHKIHLEPDLRGADGPVTLTCNDCHQLSPDKRFMEPISRKKHCASCHSLGFEERLPNVEVPHAPPDVVYQFLYAQYAQLLLAENDPVRGVSRMKPGASTETPADARRFAHSEVEQFARAAERELFTRTACKLCHEISPATNSGVGITGGATPQSLYKIVAPEIPNRWMTKAQFSHAAHDNVTCQSCHGKVQDSVRTSDAHMPKLDGCKDCHAGSAQAGKISSDCTMCHGYHDTVALSVSKKQDVVNLISGIQAAK